MSPTLAVLLAIEYGFAPAWAVAAEVIVDGTESMSGITNAWFEAVRSAHPGLLIQNGESGTSGGFIKFAEGLTDINKAAVPMREQLRARCQANGVKFVAVLVAHSADGTQHLSLYINTQSLAKGDVQKLIEFCLSDAGQALAAEHGKRLTDKELEQSRKQFTDAVKHAK